MGIFTFVTGAAVSKTATVEIEMAASVAAGQPTRQ